jgi:hypothetical protein
MSNITLFGGKFKMPAMPEGFQDNITQAIAGSSTGMPRISIRGSAFRQIVGGKEVHVSEDRSMDIVLINAAPIARTYYGASYDESTVTAPKCWSADGVTPAADVPEAGRQHDKCASCPMNIKGSGQGDTRACRFSQRLAVLLEGEIEDQKVYQLSVPATSIFGDAVGDKMPLQAYGKFLKANGVSVSAVVSRMKFDVSSSTPKLFFSAVRPLTADELAAVIQAKDSEDSIRAVTMTVSQADNVDSTATEGSANKPKTTTQKKSAKVEEDVIFEEEEETPPPVKKKAKPAPVVEEDDDDEIPEPTKVTSKKATPVVQEKNLEDLMDEWDD